MPYTTQISPQATWQIRNWGLSEPIWMEVLHLYQILPATPHALLTSLPAFPNGMLYYFTAPDPERSGFIHEFVFQVTYLADEQHLLVLRGSYWRHANGLSEG